MQTKPARSLDYSTQREQQRYYRIERRYFSQRRAEELVRDLLQAHSGE